MKDSYTHAALRRIDEELNHVRQQIFALENHTLQLEKARRTLMGLAEADAAAHAAGAAAGRGVLPGSFARPQLIVRPTGSGEAVDAHPQAKTINGKAVKKQRRRPAGTVRQELADKVTAALADGAALTSTELGDRFGLKMGKPRHDLRQALRAMIETGELTRSGTSRNFSYSLPGGHA